MNRLQEIGTELSKSNVAININLHAHFDHAKLDEFLDTEEECDDRIGVFLALRGLWRLGHVF